MNCRVGYLVSSISTQRLGEISCQDGRDEVVAMVTS